jgi:hypothetical protein
MRRAEAPGCSRDVAGLVPSDFKSKNTDTAKAVRHRGVSPQRYFLQLRDASFGPIREIPYGWDAMKKRKPLLRTLCQQARELMLMGFQTLCYSPSHPRACHCHGGSKGWNWLSDPF